MTENLSYPNGVRIYLDSDLYDWLDSQGRNFKLSPLVRKLLHEHVKETIKHDSTD